MLNLIYFLIGYLLFCFSNLFCILCFRRKKNDWEIKGVNHTLARMQTTFDRFHLITYSGQERRIKAQNFDSPHIVLKKKTCFIKDSWQSYFDRLDQSWPAWTISVRKFFGPNLFHWLEISFATDTQFWRTVIR